MCQSQCANTQNQANDEVQALQAGVVLGVAMAEQAQEDAAHATDKQTVFFKGTGGFSIKAFSSLDDAVISGAKIARLVYPSSQKTEDELDVQYRGDLLRALSVATAANPDDRYDAMIELLGLVLMGFDPDDLDDIKEDLNKVLAKKGRDAVRQNTEAFLQANGFGDVA